MSEWNDKQLEEQKRQCKCRFDKNGKKVFTCRNCRDFGEAVEGNYEVGENCNWVA